MTQQGGLREPRTIIAIVLVVILVVFALLNFQTVNVSFLVFQVDLPLFIVLVIMGAIGFLAGWLVAGRRKA
jgi:uncharacterized integral membrane protein